MSDTLDLVIRGGAVITEHGEHAMDIGVLDGRVAVWVGRGGELNGRETIDASGLMVLPGLVDAHVHLREPGAAHKEGFLSGSKAAACGGVTTMLIQPTDNPLTATPKDFEEKRELAEGQVHVDFGLQAIALDSSHIEALTNLGAASIEIFLGNVPPALKVADNADVLDILREIKRCGTLAGLTPGDDSIVAMATKRELSGGATDALAVYRANPGEAESVSIARSCALAMISGAKVHIRQVSTKASIDVLAAMRPLSSNISAEALPHYLYLIEDEIERQGAFAKVGPPLRKAFDVDALWKALADGTLDIVDTDHAPHLPEEKKAGDIWQSPGGLPGLQTMLPLMSDAVAAGRLTWSDLVRLCAQRPAELFGIFPTKGHLAPGADADIVLVDPKMERSIRNEDQMSKAAVTPFAGRRVRGWPVQVLVRGQTVMKEGRIEGAPIGRFVFAKHGATGSDKVPGDD